ncbi:nuclear pore complex assembly-domain-containing protein [Xylogone sp. PMI_703]|nr:nuclear pore complex assembly-domain-containing protein [Xylogone sp. PMI_703]
MLTYQEFNEVFSFNPDCEYEKSQIHNIDAHRKKLNGLFIDRVLKLLGIKRPSKVYPPKSNGELKGLHKAILESSGADHHKISVLYYILLDFDSLNERRDSSGSFEEKAFLPQKYQIYMQGLWHLDRLEFELALQYLTHPSLIPTFSDEILQVLVEHAGHSDLALPLAYYYTVQPILTDPHSVESLFLAIAQTNVTEAFYFSRAQPAHIQRQMFEMLVTLVLNSSSTSIGADQATELVNLPFTREEESWFEEYLLQNEGRSIRKARDAVMMRRIGKGKFNEALALRDVGSRAIGGLAWSNLSDAIESGLDKCKFEHPGDRNVPNSNRFAALQNSDSDSGSRRPYGNYQNASHMPYGLDKDAIIADLTTERPQWILSSYGPGRNAPAQLFGGSLREQSFEEMRLLHYIAAASGNTQQVIQDANQLQQASQQQIENTLRNIDGAISYIIEAEKEHPNRIDNCKTNHVANLSPHPPTQYGNMQSSNPFTTNAQLPSTSKFGIPPIGGSFGKPSVPIQSGNSFAALADSKMTPQFSATGTFGQPSALGQKVNPFGLQTSTLTSSSNNPLSTQPSSFTPSPHAFSRHSQNTTNADAFDPRPKTTLPSQPASSNTISQNNPFATNFSSNVLSSQSNPFASASSISPGEQRFSNNGSTNTNAMMNPFNNALAVSINKPSSIDQPQSMRSEDGDSHTGLNGLSRYHVPSATRDSNGQLSSFKGKPVQYRDGIAGVLSHNGKWEKIWFPDGPPPHNKDAELSEDAYDEKTKASYLYLRENGTFQDGVMPLLPPKLEWCSWDF